MTDHALEFEANLAKLDDSAWADRLDELAEEYGYGHALGANHRVVFLDAGPKLIVTFENAEHIRKHNLGAAPFGFQYAQVDGWSVLTIISDSESWFRDAAIYGYFDRLIDDGFFEDFDDVLFFGANGGAYAACAYSVASPGAMVLALRPQATIAPQIVGFDTRYTDQRRLDFTSRYGYAPDMLDAAHHAYVAFDPTQRLDAIHAALFTAKNVTPLRCNHLGGRLDLTLEAMGVLEDMIQGAMDRTLTRFNFAKMMRARRSQMTFMRALHRRAMQTGHPVLAANVCAHALRKTDDAFFETKLAELAADGYVPSTPTRRSAAE